MNDFPLEPGSYAHYDPRRKRTRRRFYKIDSSQRQLHVLLLGKSGMGKSTATINWALKDIERGLGCLFIDPHDDDAETLLELIPAHRRQDVIYFNPAEFPVSFNVLDNVPEDQWPFVASSVVDMVKTIFRMKDAPNVDMFVYTAIAALLETPDATLLGLNYMLVNPTYRNRIIAQIADPIIRDFWVTTFDEHMTDREQRDRTLSTINKLITLIADPKIRNCIGQSKSAFDFTHIIEHNKIFIASLPHGKLGVRKSSIIGSILLANFHVAALGRPKGRRSIFPAYVNEAHHFINETVCEGLTGLRKFGISFVLAHQSLMGQLTPELRAAIMGGIDTLVCFRVGPADADELARHFDKTKPDDLLRLPRHRALVHAGERTIELIMPDTPIQRSKAGAAAIRRNCRSRYSRPITEIQAEIRAFMKSMRPPPPPKPKEQPEPAVRFEEREPMAWEG